VGSVIAPAFPSDGLSINLARLSVGGKNNDIPIDAAFLRVLGQTVADGFHLVSRAGDYKAPDIGVLRVVSGFPALPKPTETMNTHRAIWYSMRVSGKHQVLSWAGVAGRGRQGTRYNARFI